MKRWDRSALVATMFAAAVATVSVSTAAASDIDYSKPALLPTRRITELPKFPGAAPMPHRIVMTRLPDHPDGPAAKLVDGLLPVAENGNAMAAYELAVVLNDCSQIPADASELEQRIADLKRKRVDIDTPIHHPKEMERDMRHQFDRCQGIPADRRGQYYDWLRRAADGGLLDALENFPLFVPPGDICREYEFSRCTADQQSTSQAARQIIGHYLLAARDAGSVNALWQLGAAYTQGELFPVDDVAAYAHLLAYERAGHAFGIADRVAAEVRNLAARLSADAREQGRQQARALLANPQCCVLIR